MLYVYLLASRKQGTLYLGVTKDLVRRVYQHKNKMLQGFSARYDIRRLVWFEVYNDPINAIEREKEIKKWWRAWKIDLIEKENPDWKDLYTDITREQVIPEAMVACRNPRGVIPDAAKRRSGIR